MRDFVVKVCGMRDPENIRAVIDSGVDAVGVICVPASPRFVAEARDSEIAAAIGDSTEVAVVFQNQPVEEVTRRAGNLRASYVQLHGREDSKFCRIVKEALPHVRVVKAIAVGSQQDVSMACEFEGVADILLFDTKAGEQSGGTGHVFDWNYLRGFSGTTKYWIGGGLGPESVDRALRLLREDLRFCGVDVNSRVETSPGVKDVAKVSEVVGRVRNVFGR